MIEETIWAGIPIHPIISFFGFFTISAFVVSFREIFETPAYLLILAFNLFISLLFFLVIGAHNIVAMTQMASIAKDPSFVVFSIAWSFVLAPLALLWVMVQKT